ncbi:MAG: hypothetical protein IJY84_01250 [Clostridia bacterium]|nr:hypothetical protein [Clostridia bacterium]
MKKLFSILLIVCFALSAALFAVGCMKPSNKTSESESEQVSASETTSESASVSESEPVTTYSVKFVDQEGNLLKEDLLEEGAVPVAPSVTLPDNTAEYTYTGEWDSEIVAVAGEATYTWIVTATKNTYTVKFVDELGETLKEEVLEYGAVPVAPSVTLPDNTAEYAYTGAWDSEIVAVAGEATYTWVVTATKNKYQVTFDGAHLTEYEYGSTVTAPVITKQGEVITGWTVNGESVDITTYQITGETDFTSVWGDVPYATYTEGYVNAVASDELGAGSWYYEIGSQATAYSWTVNIPARAYEVNKTTTYAWKAGDWSSVGFIENDWISGGGTVREGTLAVTNIGEELIIVLHEPTQNITKSTSTADADIINGIKSVTLVVNNGAQYRHFYLGAGVVTDSTIDTFVIDSEGNKYVANKTVDSVEYALSQNYGSGSVTLPKMNYSQYTKVTFDWNIAGGWTFIGPNADNRWYNGGTALGGTVTVVVRADKLEVTMAQTLDTANAGTFNLEITDADVIAGNKSLTLSYSCLVNTQQLVLSNFATSTDPVEEEPVDEPDTFVIDSEGNQYLATETESSIEYSLSQNYGNGYVTLPKTDYSQYTKVTFDWNIAGGWTFIGLETANRWYNGGTALGGTVTVVVRADKLEVTMAQTLDTANAGTFNLEITDADVIAGNKSLTLSYSCLVNTQQLVLSNFATSTDPVEDEPVIDFTPQAVGDDGTVIKGTDSSVIAGGLYFDIGNGGTARTCEVTFAVVNYSKYTTVTYEYKGSASWMGIGFASGDLITNGNDAISGTITVTNNGDGTYTAVISDSSVGATKTIEITDSDVTSGKKALSIYVYGAAYRTFNISAPTCA